MDIPISERERESQCFTRRGDEQYNLIIFATQLSQSHFFELRVKRFQNIRISVKSASENVCLIVEHFLNYKI